MSKSRVIQIAAFIIILTAIYLLYHVYINDSENLDYIMPIGFFISGISFLIMSRGKVFAKKEPE